MLLSHNKEQISFFQLNTSREISCLSPKCIATSTKQKQQKMMNFQSCFNEL